MTDTIYDIANEVADERLKQEARWGQQDHPSSYSDYDRRQYGKMADRWKRINDARVEADTIAWDGILLEEVFEALAESDDIARRAELVQVAAVAAAEIEAIDRRASETSEDADLDGWLDTVATCEPDCDVHGDDVTEGDE